MKIKYLAIALLSTTLVSTSVFAFKDKVKPIKVSKEMDKASPANASIQTSVDTVRDKVKNPTHVESATEAVSPLYEGASAPNDDEIKSEATISKTKELDKSSPKLSSTLQDGNHPNITQFIGSSSSTAQPNPTSNTGGVYIKIDDIKGDTSSDAGNKASVGTGSGTDLDSDGDDFDDDDNDGDGDDDGPATDYNSSRSNKADSVAAPDGDIDDGTGDGDDSDDNDGDGDGDGGGPKATDYNSSRSNKSLGAALTGDDNDDDTECDAETEKKVCVVTETHTTCSCTHL